jgi:chromate transport protein ChrA
MSATKPAILAEMVILFGGSIVIHRSQESDWWLTLLHSVKVAVAVVAVSAVLLTMDDLGAGSEAAAFGGLLAMGYLLGAGGALGPQLVALTNGFFGSSAVAMAPRSVTNV